MKAKREPEKIRIRITTDGQIRTIVTRAQAKAFGWKYYYTGRPCVRGHTTLRYTSCADCVECSHIRRATVPDPDPTQNGRKRKMQKETAEHRAFRRFPVKRHKPSWD